MSQMIRCPECGAPRAERLDISGKGAGGQQEARVSNAEEVSFARVLNGTPWKHKPLAPPRYRDDVVPFD